MSNQVNSMNKGLTVKDLVTTGIFTALLFVFVLVGGVFFATNPVLTFFMPAGGGLLAGPIYLLLIAKVHKRWSLSIMGVIMGIIWFVTGMHWAFALGYPSDRFTFSSHGYDLHIENELVADAFAGLSVQEQSILILHFVLDLPDQEVGRLVGMSRSAVQRRRAKSLTELRIKLAALMPKGG